MMTNKQALGEKSKAMGFIRAHTYSPLHEYSSRLARLSGKGKISAKECRQKMLTSHLNPNLLDERVTAIVFYCNSDDTAKSNFIFNDVCRLAIQNQLSERQTIIIALRETNEPINQELIDKLKCHCQIVVSASMPENKGQLESKIDALISKAYMDKIFFDLKFQLDDELDLLRSECVKQKLQGNEAAPAAGKVLIDEITKAYSEYSKKMTNESYIQFRATCTNSIETAKNQIQHSVKAKQILSNIALCVGGLGVLYLVACGVNKKLNGHFLFFKPAISKKINQVEDQLNSMHAVAKMKMM